MICDDLIGHNQPGTANVPSQESNVPGLGTIVESTKANVQPSQLGPLGVAVGELVAVDGGQAVRAEAEPATEPPETDPVATALAVALEKAARSGKWELVETLARQLENRKLDRKGA